MKKKRKTKSYYIHYKGQKYNCEYNRKTRKQYAKTLGKGRTIKTNHKYPDLSVSEGDVKFLKRWKRKFTRKDLIFVTRTKKYMPAWYEEGDNLSGQTHFLYYANNGAGHAKDFYKKYNVSKEYTPKYIKDVMEKGKVLSIRPSRDKNGNLRKLGGYDIVYKYNKKKVFVSIGQNGYIVTAYPPYNE